MRNSTPQQNSVFSNPALILRTITGSCLRGLRVSDYFSKRIYGINSAYFLYFVVFLSVLSSFSMLKAESSVSSLASQKDNFSVSPDSNPHEIKSLEAKPPSFFEKRSEGWHWY